MNQEEIREYCLSLPGVTEHFPFDEVTLVFKVGGKIFLLLSLDAHPLSMNFKGTPEQNIEWREEYEGLIIPGYHMNKTHWNTLTSVGDLSSAKVKAMVRNSYELIRNALPRKIREGLPGFAD